MLKISRTFHRPNMSIQWHWQMPLNGFEAYKSHVQEVYSQYIIHTDTEIINDTTVTRHVIWANVEKHQEFRDDSVCMNYWLSRNEYNASVGIIMDPIVETII